MASTVYQRFFIPSKKNNVKKSNEKIKCRNQENIKKYSPLDSINLVYPSGDTAFKFLILSRLCSAICNHITDCDETYNFWEPSHFLLYKNGQQTWEYSPQFALRSYTYLLIHLIPAKIYCYLLEPNPIFVFYFIRCILSVASALSEAYFYKNVCCEFGVHIARLTLAFLVLSSGMFISSAAFLPSSFSMYFSTFGIAAWYGKKYELAIFFTAISSLIGWPFASLLGLPIVAEMIFCKKDYLKFLRWFIISASVILLPMILIDYIYYGKVVVAPINLLLYNIFTSHGPNIYGTEPFSFYFYNGFLNFNFIFIGALVTPLLLFLVWSFVPAKPRLNSCLSYWYSLAPIYLWIFIFFSQPHKEERFLFPIYPLICLNGAISLDAIQKLYFFIRTKNHKTNISHYLQYTTHIMIFSIATCGFFGLSRSFMLYNGYNAPIEIMSGINNLNLHGPNAKETDINFCVGKEWHRFPSSFFFPSNSWKLRFLKSEFKGQLPQAFSNHENATSAIQSNFNDLNAEETSRYFEIEKCHFLMDLDIGKTTELEPNYSHQLNRFTIIKSSKFLDASSSHPFFRAFYIPFVSDKFLSYGSYNLLQSNKFKSTLAKQKHTKFQI